jgi:flavorubredoxin
MRKRIVKRAWLCFALLFAVYCTFVAYGQAGSGGFDGGLTAAETIRKPLILYYSLTGTTRTIAQELSRALSCETEEIVSQKYRQYLWKITCVNDQLFDRDDALAPVKTDLTKYNQLIIASPVWIHTISSPMRTLIKYNGFKNKQVWLVLTNQGNYGPADEKAIIQFLNDWGITVRGCYAVCTSAKTGQELLQHARLIAQDIAKALNQK